MFGVCSVDHFDFAHCIGKTFGLKLGFDIGLTTHDQGFAHAGSLIFDRSTQHARVITFGKNHPRLRGART